MFLNVLNGVIFTVGACGSAHMVILFLSTTDQDYIYLEGACIEEGLIILVNSYEILIMSVYQNFQYQLSYQFL